MTGPDPNPYACVPCSFRDYMRDISLGEPDIAIPKDVIWEDGDSRRPVEDLETDPYLAIALLYGYDSRGNHRASGTAFYFASGVALSAAHIVQSAEHYPDEPDHRAQFIRLWFGYSFGRSDGVSMEIGEFGVHPSFRHELTDRVDIAALRLPTKLPGSASKRYRTRLGPVNTEYRLTGFPGDGAHRGRTMVEGTSSVAEVKADRLFHRIDATMGQSGSPIWWKDQDEICIAAIHTEGTSAGNRVGLLANGATILTPDIGKWIAKQANL